MSNLAWASSAGSKGADRGLRRGAVARAPGYPEADVLRLYLVCPGCHARYHLRELAQEARCDQCGNTHPIDWASTI